MGVDGVEENGVGKDVGADERGDGAPARWSSGGAVWRVAACARSETSRRGTVP